MEAKDLMIGDYVYNHRNWECPIVEIHKDSAVVIARHYGEEEFLLSDLRPIPLTTEILEKNGWVNQHFGTQRQEWWLDKTKFPIVRYSVNDTLHHNGIVLKFVHQLQHALKVCGIDKEIEL